MTSHITSQTTKSQVYLALIGAVFLAGLYYEQVSVNNYFFDQEQKALQAQVENQTKISTSISVVAKAYYVYDATTDKVLFQKNAKAPLALASLVKVMTALVAENYLDQNEDIYLSPYALQSVGDTGLLEGDHWELNSLLPFALVSSSNDAIQAIAETIEVQHSTSIISLMNREAAQRGLTSMQFFNSTGLDITDQINGGYGSAEDIAKLFGYTILTYPSLYEQTKFPSAIFYSTSQKPYSAQNTNHMVDSFSSIIASKTGYTTLAGGNLLIARKMPNEHIIIFALLGSTYVDRFTDMLALSRKADIYAMTAPEAL